MGVSCYNEDATKKMPIHSCYLVLLTIWLLSSRYKDNQYLHQERPSNERMHAYLFSFRLWLSFFSLNNMFLRCIHIDLCSCGSFIPFHCQMVFRCRTIPQLKNLLLFLLVVIWIVSRSLLWTFFFMASGAQVQDLLRTYLRVELLGMSTCAMPFWSGCINLCSQP